MKQAFIQNVVFMCPQELHSVFAQCFLTNLQSRMQTALDLLLLEVLLCMFLLLPLALPLALPEPCSCLAPGLTLTPTRATILALTLASTPSSGQCWYLLM